MAADCCILCVYVHGALKRYVRGTESRSLVCREFVKHSPLSARNISQLLRPHEYQYTICVTLGQLK